ncbi:hypothetical protein F4808DRAFT_410309 [Astrocystis sublimbata]|nr:hypothetical protein F4808DRAFT_410309 [Astrocystis sublimbata]
MGRIRAVLFLMLFFSPLAAPKGTGGCILRGSCSGRCWRWLLPSRRELDKRIHGESAPAGAGSFGPWKPTSPVAVGGWRLRGGDPPAQCPSKPPKCPLSGARVRSST